MDSGLMVDHHSRRVFIEMSSQCDCLEAIQGYSEGPKYGVRMQINFWVEVGYSIYLEARNQLAMGSCLLWEYKGCRGSVGSTRFDSILTGLITPSTS